MEPTTDTESALFQSIFVGQMELQHRVVMAPMSRLRADQSHVPLPDIVAEYYSQRASVRGTLVISEATIVDPKAGGEANVPGIWNEQQIQAWKKVTTAVHEKQSFIFSQLCAWGRRALPSQLEQDGVKDHFVSASTIPLSARPPSDPRPRALGVDEIQEYARIFAQAAANAVELAGFDGVEIHAGNGYLLDQFLQDVSNDRSDAYGGNIENRSKFVLNVVDAVVQRVGPTKTAVKITPWSREYDMGMTDPVPTYTYLVEELGRRHPTLAYIHVGERQSNDDAQGPAQSQRTENDFIRHIWSAEGKRLISSGGYTCETGMEVADMKGDIVAYGRSFISNPDLPFRLRHGLDLAEADSAMFILPGSTDPKGYTDYPFSAVFEARNSAE